MTKPSELRFRHACNLKRRWFLRDCGVGLGGIALQSLLAGERVPALSLRQAAVNAGLLEGNVPHRAMGDTRLTLETFRHYVGRLALLPLDEVPPPES